MNNVLFFNEAPCKGQIIVFIIPFKPNNTAQHFIIIGRHTELLIAYSPLRQNHNNGFQQWSPSLPHINLQLNRP